MTKYTIPNILKFIFKVEKNIKRFGKHKRITPIDSL